MDWTDGRTTREDDFLATDDATEAEADLIMMLNSYIMIRTDIIKFNGPSQLLEISFAWFWPKSRGFVNSAHRKCDPIERFCDFIFKVGSIQKPLNKFAYQTTKFKAIVWFFFCFYYFLTNSTNK